MNLKRYFHKYFALLCRNFVIYIPTQLQTHFNRDSMELFLLDYMVYAKKTTSCSSCAERENFGVSDVSSCPWPGSTTIVGHYLACCDWPMDVFVYFF